MISQQRKNEIASFINTLTFEEKDVLNQKLSEHVEKIKEKAKNEERENWLLNATTNPVFHNVLKKMNPY